MSSQPGTSLNKFIAASGMCSRREADELVRAGRVTLNGEPARGGMRVTRGDVVLVDGEPVGRKPNAVWLAYHKPAGVTCTTDRRVRSNIVDAVAYPKGRVFPVGRLDRDSEGLIWLTNDGDQVNKILRKANAHEKEYLVTVDRNVSRAAMRRIREGIYLPELRVATLPAQVEQVAPRTLRIVLTQGLNRQIRRMLGELGYDVTRLRRTRIMFMELGELPVGVARDFSQTEVRALKQALRDSQG